MIEITNFLVRLSTIIPLGVIVGVLGVQYLRHLGSNGLTPVRKGLFLLSLGMGAEIIVRLVGDVVYFCGLNSVQGWLTDVQWVIVIARIVYFVGVLQFAKLVLAKHE
jgi:hypothetical protein